MRQESKGAGTSHSQTSTTETQPSRPVSIEIGGTKLSVKSDKDPAYVQGLAAYLDAKVAELRAAAPTVTLDKVLMLVSMTIVEELFEARERVENFEGELQERLEVCLALLDEVDGEFQ